MYKFCIACVFGGIHTCIYNGNLQADVSITLFASYELVKLLWDVSSYRGNNGDPSSMLVHFPHQYLPCGTYVDVFCSTLL